MNQTILISIAKDQEEGMRIVFTNGVFDILHRGHVQYLSEAKAMGDILVVGLNSDASVRTLDKGSSRPYNSQEDRKIVLEHLAAVDHVLIFDDQTPLELIEKINPAVLVKGGDYDADEADENHPRYIVGSKSVNARGGETAVIQFVNGFSTTNLINAILEDGKN